MYICACVGIWEHCLIFVGLLLTLWHCFMTLNVNYQLTCELSANTAWTLLHRQGPQRKLKGRDCFLLAKTEGKNPNKHQHQHHCRQAQPCILAVQRTSSHNSAAVQITGLNMLDSQQVRAHVAHKLDFTTLGSLTSETLASTSASNFGLGPHTNSQIRNSPSLGRMSELIGVVGLVSFQTSANATDHRRTEFVVQIFCLFSLD